MLPYGAKMAFSELRPHSVVGKGFSPAAHLDGGQPSRSNGGAKEAW